MIKINLKIKENNIRKLIGRKFYHHCDSSRHHMLKSIDNNKVIVNVGCDHNNKVNYPVKDAIEYFKDRKWILVD